MIRLVVKSLGESAQQSQVSACYFDSALEMVFSVVAVSFYWEIGSWTQNHGIRFWISMLFEVQDFEISFNC